jgi:predicted ATPase
VQILRSSVPEVGERALPPASLEELGRLVPELRTRPPRRDAPLPDGPEARFRLYDGVAAYLRAAAKRAPVVLLLDDLHWADASSLRLLCFVARETREARVLLVGTYRAAEGERGPAAEALAELARLPGHVRIPLEGLSRDEVAELVATSARIAPEPARLDAIRERTDGNPFFIRELVQMLDSDGWQSAIPLAVKDTIARRLARLSPEARAALDAAAVIGRDFALDLLERSSGTSGGRWRARSPKPNGRARSTRTPPTRTASASCTR